MIQSSAIGVTAVSIASSDTPAADAFGRLRVSNPSTIFETQSQYGLNPLRVQTGNSGADAVAPSWSSSTRLITLGIVAGGTGGTSFLQSYEYLPYQAGKSQFVAITGVMRAATAGAVKRFGYGDASNGIFFEQNGTSGFQFNRRTSTSGVTVDNPVTQANWNLDKFDGSGPSGVNLDPTKCFILVIDLQYLGMGRVRIGFDVNGVIYYAHQFLNANVLSVPYMQTGTLPIVAEVVAAAGLAANANADFKCATVVSEGGLEVQSGRSFTVEGTVTAASGARTHILSLRPKTTFNGITNRGFFRMVNVDLLGGAAPVYYEIVVGAAFSVAPTFADVNTSYSFTEAGTGGTFSNLTNGIVLASGYIGTASGNARYSLSEEVFLSVPITLDRAGAQRAMGTISILVTGIGGTSACRVAPEWIEIR